MKKMLSLAICLVVMANLVACGNNGKSAAVKTPIYPMWLIIL